MAINWVPYNRVRETSASSGTGTIALAGAVTKYQAFGDRYSNGDSMVVCIEHDTADEWEVSECTWSSGGNTLARDTVIESSNSDALVSFSSGGLKVFVVNPASYTFLVAAGMDYDNANGRLGIGTSSPDTALHIYSGSAGSVSPSANTGLTIEHSSDCYISFLNPNTSGGGIYFGDPDSNVSGFIIYDHSNDSLGIRTGLVNVVNVDSGGLYVGDAFASAGARIHSHVSTTDAIPCLELEQNDVSEPIIEFDVAEAASTANPATSYKSGHSLQGFLRCSLNGTDFWMPRYSAPDSSNAVDGLEGICTGRLTTESGVPVSTSDRTSQSTLYFTNGLKGGLVSLYDGSNWVLYKFTNISKTLTGLVSGRPYDVFLYDNSGTLTLDFTAWTNTTTRATALTTQNGVPVKTGATSRRYLGTFYTTSTTTTADSATMRYVWNYYNQVERTLFTENGATGHTYSTATWREWNGGTSGPFRLYFVSGKIRSFQCGVMASIQGNDTNTGIISLALNSSSSEGRPTAENQNAQPIRVGADATYDSREGFNELVVTEYSTGTGVTFYLFKANASLLC